MQVWGQGLLRKFVFSVAFVEYLRAEDAVAFISVSTVDLKPLKSFQNKICSKSMVVK